MELILKRTSSSHERDRLYIGDAFIGWVKEVRMMGKSWKDSRLANGVYTIADPYIVQDIDTKGLKLPMRGIALTLAYDEVPADAAAVLFQVYSQPGCSGILYPGTFRRVMELAWLAGVLKEEMSIRICPATEEGGAV